MRYLLSVDLLKNRIQENCLSDTELSDVLTVDKTFRPEEYINLSVLTYDRKSPGLVEKNWQNPIYNDENYFLFIGGFVLNRNRYVDIHGSVPSPQYVLEVALKNKRDIHSYFKGCFYIIILNKISMEVEILSSPMFMYPSFYAIYESKFIFSNFLGSFGKFFPYQIDNQGLLEFSLFDHCIDSRTIYQGIKSVQGGMLIKINDNNVSEEIVYDIVSWYSKTPMKRKKALPMINQSLTSSIGEYLRSTEKFNVALTGGFDGRLNFSFIKPSEYSRLQAYSYGMENSSQLTVPQKISKSLKFRYTPICLDEDFEKKYASLGLKTIYLTAGITGFNRAVYPYAYGKTAEFSRSCLLGQCDMIRPYKSKMTAEIKNRFSSSIFFGTYEEFRKNVQEFSSGSFLNEKYFTDESIDNIYHEIKNRYVDSYRELDSKLKMFFFLMKESVMKYWHTEFHVVDLFVDDYVSFADLDYLEILFSSKYASIYKGLFSDKQINRKSPHDLYVDLMTLNNNKLNHFYNDRSFKPFWLKYGKIGWLICGLSKKITKMKKKGNDTFSPSKWGDGFYNEYKNLIDTESSVFNNDNLRKYINKEGKNSSADYRFFRAISLKIWLNKIGIE